jgi:hypothetical protein
MHAFPLIKRQGRLKLTREEEEQVTTGAGGNWEHSIGCLGFFHPCFVLHQSSRVVQKLLLNEALIKRTRGKKLFVGFYHFSGPQFILVV